jgi:TP901 family phage tail tape measure protein
MRTEGDSNMAGNLIKSIMVMFGVDPGDTHEQIDDLNTKVLELSKRPWVIDVNALTAEAQEGVDEVTQALIDYNDAALKAEQASADLAEAQADDSASSDRLAAAMDANAEATVRALDAQIRLLAAEEKAAAGADVEGDAQEVAGDKSLTAGEKGAEGGTLMAGAWEKAKLAMLGLVVGLAYGMDKAAGFQSVITMLGTQAGVARNQLGMLGSGVLDLAGQVGENPDSLAMGLYHVESSFQSVGITGSKALSLLKIAAEGAATGHADLVDTVNALDATIVAQVPGIHSYSQAMGVLNATVGSGDMTMQDLANAMGSGVMAVAKNYGQSIYQVGAALAVFGDNNIRGAKAATDLRMAWQAMQAPIKTGLPLLESLGLTQQRLADEMETHGMSGAIKMFIQHLNDSKVPMSQWGEYETEIFGKKAGVGIGILISQYDRLMSKFPDMEHSANDFGGAWKQTEATVTQQMHQLEDGTEALAIKLGEKLLPVGLKVVHWVTDFVNDLEEGKAPALGIAFAIGSVLAGVALEKLGRGIANAEQGFESLWNAGSRGISMISSLIGRLGAQTAATDEATAATEAQAAATEEEAAAQTEADAAMDANPIGIIIVALAALGAGIYEVVKHWKDFRQWGLDAWHDVRDVTLSAWHDIDSGAIQPLERGVQEVEEFFGSLVDEGETDFDRLEEAVARDAGDVITWFEQLPGRILHGLGDVGMLLWHAGVSIVEGLIGGVSSMFGAVADTAGHLVDSLGHSVLHLLGIGSPSRVAHYWGEMVGLGMAKGLDDSHHLVAASAAGLAMSAIPQARSLSGGGYGGSVVNIYNRNEFGIVGNPHQTAVMIQQLLLTLARQHGFQPNTSAGLGLA